MNAMQLREAARITLKRFIQEGKDETDRREFSGVVYKDDMIVVINYMRKETDEFPKQKVFKIEAIARAGL